MELHLDLETRSTVELKSAGVYRYAEDPTTDIWCACYAVDDGPVQSWEPGDPVPQEVIDAVANGYRVVAHNAQFERTVWRLILAPRYGWPGPDLEQWHCTAAMAAAMSLPRDLAGAASALGLPVQKDDVGRRLMLQMTKPRAVAPDGRLEWYDDRKRLDRLIEYCRQDVEVERALGRMLLPLIPTERSLFLLDARINDRGILVDLPLVRASQQVVEKTMRRLDARLEEATGGVIARATQVSRITRWLQMEGLETESLDKAALGRLLAQHHDPDIQAVLETRQEAAKSSTAKLKAMAACAGADGRARGMLQFLGAARTGRFAGRLAQPQNFPRGSLPKGLHPEACISALLTGDDVLVDTLWAPPLTVVSSTLRSMFMAEPGKTLIAADYANIEGRVLAWLAGETWKIEAFRAFDAGRGADLYKLAAAGIYAVAVDAVDDAQRQIGKVSELALGYQGGVGAFQTMAANYGLSIPDEQANEIKVAWRESNPAIVAFWYDLDRAAAAAVGAPGTLVQCGPVRWVVHKNFLWCRLPSGRRLCYAAPRLKEMASFTLRDGTWFSVPAWKADRDPRVIEARAKDLIESESSRTAVAFDGLNPITRRWTEHYGYGGLWAENITQAVARDVMCEGMLRLDAAGYHIVLTVHDEVVCEEDDAWGSVGEVERILCELPAWLTGCPVSAKGWRGRRYRKG